MNRKRHDIETDVKVGPFYLTFHVDRSGWLNLHFVSLLLEEPKALMIAGHKCQHPPDEADDPNGMKLPKLGRGGFVSGYFHRYPWYWPLSAKVR